MKKPCIEGLCEIERAPDGTVIHTLIERLPPGHTCVDGNLPCPACVRASMRNFQIIYDPAPGSLPYNIWAEVSDLNDTSRVCSGFICACDTKSNAELVRAALEKM